MYAKVLAPHLVNVLGYVYNAFLEKLISLDNLSNDLIPITGMICFSQTLILSGTKTHYKFSRINRTPLQISISYSKMMAPVFLDFRLTLEIRDFTSRVTMIKRVIFS